VKRVGHAGTLDPLAEGVLPVCLGQATRIVEYLMDARKTYQARVRFGQTTDTYDIEGRLLLGADTGSLTRQAVEEALSAFTGEIDQRPPPYSAIKREGVPLYRLARAGKTVEVEARRVVIHRVELREWSSPVATLEVECGKGTYIRSLAHDLGEALGVGAVLEGLVRSAVGPFTLERSISIDRLAPELDSDAWKERLIALDEVMLEWPAAILGPENTTRVLSGRAPLIELAAPPDRRLRAYSTEGDFLAVLKPVADVLRPEKVFPAS
jgi:tRNA pseudouridine55 synthase